MQTSSRQSTPSIIMDSHGIFIHLNQTLNPALIIDRVRGQPGIQSIPARWILGLGRVVKIVEEIDNCVIETFSASLLLPPQTPGPQRRPHTARIVFWCQRVSQDVVAENGCKAQSTEYIITSTGICEDQAEISLSLDFSLGPAGQVDFANLLFWKYFLQKYFFSDTFLANIFLAEICFF